jgi:DNA-binding NtrC family response regulator
MDLSMQVKLLRVMETRRFAPVGDTALREFKGKFIAATNRDLPAEIRAGRFREDLYYRLCADLIQTPSLADQVRDSPGVLDELVHYMVLRSGAEDSLDEVLSWIREHLPGDYAWPGNYRELEQCVRNVMIRGSYRPLAAGVVGALEDCERTADEVVAEYAARMYRKTGSYEEAAKRLGMDRRTVRKKVAEFLGSKE